VHPELHRLARASLLETWRSRSHCQKRRL
jgi:hypothetical protein